MSALLLRRLLRSSSVRSSLGGRRVFSNGFSSSVSSSRSSPCYIVCGFPIGEDLGKLVIHNVNEVLTTELEKKVQVELLDEDAMITVGAAHGWVGTMKADGILRLQDDLNPFASHSDPKRITLPPLVTLPGCQTKMVTNVSMSSPSPEDEGCVVAVKFLGPQLSFCRPGQSQWTNIRVHHCFDSSRVMFSEKDGVFCLPGSGGQLIGSWDPNHLKDKPKIQRLKFQDLPELNKTKRELLHSCSTTEHLVESLPTGETFLVKWYRKADLKNGRLKMKTRALMVFKLDGQGNALYTRDIGDLSMFFSKSEPFCVYAASFPGLYSNCVRVLDLDEHGHVFLSDGSYFSFSSSPAPYFVPPQSVI